MQAIKQFFFWVLYQPLFNLLFFLAWLVPGHSIGWAIILLTIIIRLILIPSTNQMMAHQQQLKSLQPKLAELKRVHADDKAAETQATMELYKAEQISPFGGCLASLVQLPLLLVMYRVFEGGLKGDPSGVLYSFMPHFTLNTHWFGLDLTRPEPWVLPIIVAVLQYFQIRQTSSLNAPAGNSKGNEDISQMMTKQMAIIMPIVIWSIARKFPAALSLYYATFSLFMIIQQGLYLRRAQTANTGDLAVVGSSAEPKKKSSTVSTKAGDVTVTVRKKNGGSNDDK